MKPIYPAAALLAMSAATIALAQAPLGQAKSPPVKSTSPAARAASAPAAAPPRTDANCLLVSNIFAQRSTDPAQKTHAANVLFYYFGRVDGRMSEAELKAELKQAGSVQFTSETAAALMNSCVQNMQSRAQTLQSISQQLQPVK